LYKIQELRHKQNILSIQKDSKAIVFTKDGHYFSMEFDIQQSSAQTIEKMSIEELASYE